ncbi:glycosyltransferase family 31 protein [Auriscalpium vulgare]|uniref:Glycosyltransferase family 31 protein n=1 Tax=Auriscalpium vulgare TaxID=40419 RepID=A0ACB8SAF0_9AGAM|nr:glycosyltransferase family 31 protein [Auriscalpium vulgare]
MPANLGPLSSSAPRPLRLDEGEDSDDPQVSPESPISLSVSYASQSRTRAPFSSSLASNAHNSRTAAPDYTPLLYPSSLGAHASSRTSLSSTAMNTPIPSRSGSPLPHFYSSGPSSPSSSDTESEPGSPLLAGSHWARDERPRWWHLRPVAGRRRRRERGWSPRSLKRFLRGVFRHPFFPKTPITILLSLLFFSVFAVSITVLLIHILNPDKEPLPWRAYCSVPPPSTDPPPSNISPTYFNVSAVASSPPIPAFPPPNFDSLPPAGVFLGVFSVDSSFDRRMMIRTSWASHPRSRQGAGAGDGGDGTSRTIVRFIMGQPRKAWERRITLEMEKYHDIVILPVTENMNGGKTYTFFTWAAQMAWVPPLYFNTQTPLPQHSYSNHTNMPPRLAAHDPPHTWADLASEDPLDWVRPDFVVKADDDSFVMLAELEARLRVALHKPVGNSTAYFADQDLEVVRRDRADASATTIDVPDGSPSTTYQSPAPQETPSLVRSRPSSASLFNDPLIYWGYLVKHRFMAGEMYGLSWSIVDWIANDPVVKTMTRGAEDKQTAKWMRIHPRAEEVRWTSEHCYIYDHPRSGTVYSHGFLFPSEVTRVRKSVMAYFDKPFQKMKDEAEAVAAPGSHQPSSNPSVPTAWSDSTVSTFGERYSPPVPDLTTLESVEALIEGSTMSQLHEESILTPRDAWRQREGRKTRYDGQRLGGTIVVHFIKKHMWFLEAAIAFLEGEDETALDVQRRLRAGNGSTKLPNHRPRPHGSTALSPPTVVGAVGH